MNLKERVKNYGFWTSLSAAVVIVVETILSAMGKPIGGASVFGDIVMAICSLLVVLGIVSNPKEGKWWNDTVATKEEAKTPEIATVQKEFDGETKTEIPAVTIAEEKKFETSEDDEFRL